MRLIPNWTTKKGRCWFCGNPRSVKYYHEIRDSAGATKTVCVCNRCALLCAREEEDK